jgi:hypothetical protein
VTSPFVFLAGGALFFWGFWTYRKYRVLADTPELPIRSVAMGLVEIHGKATGEKLFTSPVTRVPCLFFKAQFDRYVGAESHPNVNGAFNWKLDITDMQGESFNLEDQTGKIRVFPRTAELDLPCTLRMVHVPGHPDERNIPSTADSELAEYIRTTKINHDRENLSKIGQPAMENVLLGFFGGAHVGTYRVAEFCILPDHSYDVTGTCVENPHPQDEHDRNLIVKGLAERTYVISSKSEKAVEQDLRRRAGRYVFRGGILMVASLALWLVAWHFAPE